MKKTKKKKQKRVCYYGIKPCWRCGRRFKPWSSNARWCSVVCREGGTAKCKHCHRRFVPARHTVRKFCSTDCSYEHRVPTGTTMQHPGGYLWVKVPVGTPGTLQTKQRHRNRWMMQHRYVMQESLGRPLEKHETVHHKNGDKTDNRIENLELWAKRHTTAGVRVSDIHCPGCRCFEGAAN